MFYVAGGGLIFGAIISVVFNIYSKYTANLLSTNVFGVSVSVLVFNTIMFLAGFGLALLSGYSALIRDLSYPIFAPISFTIETILMGLLPSLIIFVMTLLRGYIINSDTWVEFTILFLKFGLLHILLQFSGFYSVVFPFKKA